jgi:hypothetical protein
VVVSPVSIKLVLAMLYEGAAGNTAWELEKTLQLPARLQSRKKFSAIIDSLLVSILVTSAVYLPNQSLVHPATHTDLVTQPLIRIFTVKWANRSYIHGTVVPSNTTL